MTVYSVSHLTTYLRGVLESDPLLGDLWVQGEISNLSQPSSGHQYFVLKDADAQLRCVRFRQHRFGMEPAAGQEVLAHGRISLYEARGELQLYVDFLQPAGLGAQRAEFELLKARLEAEGLFEETRKRPLPAFPQRIGVVTSPTGAVFHDIVRVVERRYPLAELVLAPTPVQGDHAVAGIAAALQALHHVDGIEVIIVARGGGSWEELAPFNDEAVARAIFGSRIPVVTGIGHETDFTIADFVADRRAPTPSAAAELAVPDQQELRQRLEETQRTLRQLALESAYRFQSRLRLAQAHLQSVRPDLSGRQQRLRELSRLSGEALRSSLALWDEKLRGQGRQLAALSPFQTLERGYALVHAQATGAAITRVGQAAKGESLTITVADGSFPAKVAG